MSSGPNGVDRRSPFMSGGETSLSITDPFILYQNYIKQGLLERDELQLRVMKEFQKLYQRVINYTPPEDLQIKISLLMRKLELKQAQAIINDKKAPMLRNYVIKNLFKIDPQRERKQLVKLLTDEEELINFNSPQGLLINGEVGCGKSMLMDIFADSLPHQSKMRWHFNNFILWVYNEIHKIQNEKLMTASAYNGKNRLKLTLENEFILFEIAQKMINKNTILMLDEFMLPDIASANIIKILFTYYFKLGGVLIATSNKLPEELYSNEFHKKNFKTFVNILNYRCLSVDMRSEKDYRVKFSLESNQQPYNVVKYNNEDNHQHWLRLIKEKALKIPVDSPKMDDSIDLMDLGGKPSTIKVYNRETLIPLTFDNNVCYLDFDHICKGLHSSSDYITLASSFKIIILDNVPILTTKMKNEARRFITLLDAIYESKCQFFVRSEVPIDYIFFPDAIEDVPQPIKNMATILNNDNNLEVQDEEMFSKTQIALSNPYRPNVATYDQGHTSEYSEETNKEVQVQNVNDMKAFTGEDERFAYKRAVSRIKEMIGSESWRNSDRWVPIDKTMRPWETKKLSITINQTFNDEYIDEELKDLDKSIISDNLPRDLALQYNIPFRKFNAKLAPIFSNIQHFWSLGKWNKNAKIKDKIAQSWINSSK